MGIGTLIGGVIGGTAAVKVGKHLPITRGIYKIGKGTINTFRNMIKYIGGADEMVIDGDIGTGVKQAVGDTVVASAAAGVTSAVLAGHQVNKVIVKRTAERQVIGSHTIDKKTIEVFKNENRMGSECLDETPIVESTESTYNFEIG